MKTQKNFSIINTTKSRLPRLPFLNIKEKIIGKHYRVSLVIIGDMRSRTLNKKYRGKDMPANVLTFPVAKNEGEIFLNPRQIKRNIRQFQKSYGDLYTLMFIHALLHLKGRQHNSTMDKEEEALLKKFLK